MRAVEDGRAADKADAHDQRVLARGQTFKFPLRNERQLLGAEADQALTS